MADNTLQGITRKFPAIPHPQPDIKSLHTTMLALKEAVEIFTRQRGNSENSGVLWSELVQLGLVDATQVPSK